MVFNELSADTLAESRSQGRQWLEQMLDSTAAVADGRALDFVAVRSCDLFGVVLSPGYAVNDWLRDGDRDLRKLFWKITTKTGLGEHIESAVKDRFYVSMFFLDDGAESNREVEAPGLGLAYLLDGVAASLASDERWCRPVIDIRHLWLDGEAQEQTENGQVVNVSRPADAEATTDRLYRIWKSAMWHRRSSLSHRTSSEALASFRHLVFGMDVAKQFRGLAVEDRRVVWGKFIELDSAVREWRRGKAKLPAVPGVRSEGKATMDQFGHGRVYRDRHGEDATYELHVSAGSRRVHFRIEPAGRAIEIGYVGKHLPTKKFPN